MNLSQAIALVRAQNEAVVKRVRHSGFPVSVEHPRGTDRVLKDDAGKVVFKKFMHHDYGYFENTVGRDGDQVDVMLGPIADPDDVFIIHMIDKGKDVSAREDEDKVMLGFPSAEAARQAFFLHYPKNFFGGMTVLPMKTFKDKLATASLPFHKRKIAARG